MGKRYFLQNRHQDSGWEDLSGDRFQFDSWQAAIDDAVRCSRDAICYGMVRVVDSVNCVVIQTFPAGGLGNGLGMPVGNGRRIPDPAPPPTPDTVILSRADYDRLMQRVADLEARNADLEARLADESPLAKALAEADKPEPIDGEWW
jgi:hypothetical protein